MPQGQTLDQIFSATQTPTKVSTASGSLSSGTMQTLDQAFGSVKSSAPVDSMATHNFLDSAFNPKPTTPISTSPFDMSGDIAANTPEADAARASTGIHIGPTVMQGVNDAGNAITGTGKYEGQGTAARATGAVSDIASIPVNILMKLLPQEAQDDITSAVNKGVGYLSDNPLSRAMGFNEAIQTLVDKHPDATNILAEAAHTGQNLGNIAGTILGAEGGAKGAPVVANEAGNIASDVNTLAGKASTPISDVVGTVANKASDIASNIKEKIAPSATLEQTVGQVAQGGADEIPKFTKGLSNLDTSGVKTYEDLTKTAGDTIKTEAKAQDTALAAASTPLKVQQMAIKVGDQEAAHNYVIDAVSQLKDYFTKTNDIANLAKVNSYAEKLNPTTGEGLTVQDINNIARMHGTNLNAYNANGELASGLTKQAAENTRQGLKQTVVQNIKDPAMQAEFKAYDAKMSSLYTVRDLSGKMAEKVNKLTQRLQKPNILQKLGSIIGQVGKISGIGDIAQKLIGIEKVPGASTLNAVELQARLVKNLAKINEALGKDDAGFVKDVQDMLQSDKSTPNNTSTTKITANQPANTGESAQSMKNNSNQAMSKDNITFQPKSKTGQLIQNAIKKIQETPNKQGGFIGKGVTEADAARDEVMSRLSKLDANDFMSSNGKLNMEAVQQHDDLMSRFEKKNETPDDMRSARELLMLLKK